ncbi:hypothetical protein H4219_005421, partial [Mycoemilia scoparia]
MSMLTVNQINSSIRKTAYELINRSRVHSTERSIAIFDYIINRSDHRGHIRPLFVSEPQRVLKGVLKNLSLAHQSASSGQKSALLAIAAPFVGMSILKQEYQFQFSKKQFSLAKEKAERGDFSLAPYKRTTPPSRQSVSEAKKAIYEKMVAEHPEYKVALSTFYKYCPKNFKPPVKKTDMCPVCTQGEKIEQQISSLPATHPQMKQLEESYQ